MCSLKHQLDAHIRCQAVVACLASQCQADIGRADSTRYASSTFLCAARPENSIRPRSALMSCSSASGAARSRVSVALSSESSASAWSSARSSQRKR